MDDLTADCCDGCKRQASPAAPVTWSPAYLQHLCSACRVRRTDAELSATERSNAAARLTAKGASVP